MKDTVRNVIKFVIKGLIVSGIIGFLGGYLDVPWRFVLLVVLAIGVAQVLFNE